MDKSKYQNIFTFMIAIFVAFLFLFLNVVIADASTNNNKETKHHDLRKIAPYTYEITYDDYAVDYNLENLDLSKINIGSSVARNGNTIGRNFDSSFSEFPEFIVRIKANENRYASIGIVQDWDLQDELVEQNKYDNELDYVPNITLDGMNQCGLVVCANVVVSNDHSKIDGTNPDGENAHILSVARRLLDSCKDADIAVDKMKKLNIFGDLGNKYSLHFMISDKNKTYIVEIFDNKVVAEEKYDNNRIMTNYYSNFDSNNNNVQGIERAEILKQNYNEGNTFDGMTNLINSVSFATVPKQVTNNAFFTDFGIDYNKLISMSDIEKQNVLRNYQDMYNKVTSTDANRKNVDNSILFTVHTATYNNNSLNVRYYFQQDYSKYFDYVITDDLSNKPSGFGIWQIIIIAAGLLIVAGCVQGIVKHKKKNKNKKS